jgi:hypothetical protein
VSDENKQPPIPEYVGFRKADAYYWPVLALHLHSNKPPGTIMVQLKSIKPEKPHISGTLRHGFCGM